MTEKKQRKRQKGYRGSCVDGKKGRAMREIDEEAKMKEREKKKFECVNFARESWKAKKTMAREDNKRRGREDNKRRRGRKREKEETRGGGENETRGGGGG